MKRRALEQVVEKRMHKMHEYSQRIPGSFAADDIHDLRVEYKKARAFVRLLQLRVPADLKDLYQSAGKVRDLQLFIDNFPIAADCFLEHRRKQLFQCKEALVVTIEQTHFKQGVHRICKDLPHQLHEDAIQSFIVQRIATIHIILQVAEGENDLHDIRKQVKDIIYNRKLLKEEESLADIATRLGTFNDRCHALALLSLAQTEQLPQEEKQVIHQLQQTWLREKEEEQQQLLAQFQQLPIEYTH